MKVLMVFLWVDMVKYLPCTQFLCLFTFVGEESVILLDTRYHIENADRSFLRYTVVVNVHINKGYIRKVVKDLES